MERSKRLMSTFCQKVKGSKIPLLLIAANEQEFKNLCLEFGAFGFNIFENGKLLAEMIALITHVKTIVLLHTELFSTAFEAGAEGSWVVPCHDIKPVRLNNAGDTWAGAFISAYLATNELVLSVAFANLATAKRLAHDELPTAANMKEFARVAAHKNVVEGILLKGVKLFDGHNLRQKVSSQAAASAPLKRAFL